MEGKQSINSNCQQTNQQQNNNSIQIVLPANNSQLRLSIEDFYSFNQFLNNQQMQSYVRETPNFKYSRQIMHVFLYFILAVGKQFIVDPAYEEICRKQVAQFYVKKSMKIQTYEYALVCSKIIGTKVQFCLHIVYFLVYGRLASVPYIQSICNSKNFRYRKTLIMKTSKPIRDYSKSKNGSLVGRTIYQTDIQFKNLKRQLKGILKTQKDPSKNLVLRPKTQRRNIQISAFKQQEQKNKQNQSFLPTRIQNRQNSALIQAISNSKPKVSKFIRKKKFEDISFNWSNTMNPNFSMQETSKEDAFFERQNKLDRKTACNFYSITQNLKSSSRVLDSVRTNDLRQKLVNINSKQNRKKTSDRSFALQQQLQMLQKQHLELQERVRDSNNPADQSDPQQIEEKPQPMRSLLRKQDQNDNEFRQSENQYIFNKISMFKKRPILKTLKYRQQYKNFLDTLILNVDFED